MPLRFVCNWCRSPDVSRDAWADWDVAAQAWVLRQVFDDGYCQSCGTWRGLDEVEDGAIDSHNVANKVEISYDQEKRERTLRERDLDFDDAPTLFDGPSLTLADVRFDYPEPRYQTYGWLRDRMVLMAWTPSGAGIRVISMRHCHGKEQRRLVPRMG